MLEPTTAVAACATDGGLYPRREVLDAGSQQTIDAAAPMLGHKTLAKTMVYARIVDKTVADEYCEVTEKVEALDDRPHELPADDDGAEMRKLRPEVHQRMSATVTAPVPPRLAFPVTGRSSA